MIPDRKNSDIDISVIAPVYNVENYVVDCLQSIITQKIQGNIEIIVIDDASTDNSLKIVQGNFRHIPDLKIIQNDKNIGLGASRNVGLEIARGKYMYFMDSDDILQAGALQILHDADIIHSCSYYELPNEHVHLGERAVVEIRRDDLYSSSPQKVSSDVVKRLNEGYIQYGYRCMVWLNLYKKDFPAEKDCFSDLRFTLTIYILWLACQRQIIYGAFPIYSIFTGNGKGLQLIPRMSDT